VKRKENQAMLFSGIFSFIYIRSAEMACSTSAGGLSSLAKTVTDFISSVTGLLTGLGVAVSVVGIIVGGLMRATAFGNERKVAQSNQAIACAVVGLIIVGLAQVAGPAVNTMICGG
jgi:purine-cytosine permease-like protein